jgi:hypothetical protein
MIRSLFKLIVSIIFSILVGAIAFAVFGYSKLIVADVACNLQTNNTYTCNITERVWNTDYVVREKQVENVIGIQSDATNSCKRNCARRVELKLTSGETTPVRNSYGDSDLAFTMVTTVTEKIENKEKEILYTTEINKFWDLYFPISIVVIVMVAMLIQSFVQFFINIRNP